MNFHFAYFIWKLIFVRSNGAITVLARAPAIAPEIRLVITISWLCNNLLLFSKMIRTNC